MRFADFGRSKEFFRGAADHEPLYQQAQKAKQIAHALGPARDWDVFVGEVLPALAESGYARAGFARLVAAAHAHRAAAWASASAQIADPAFSKFALDLLAMANLPSWRTKALDISAKRFAVRTLDRAHQKTRKVGRKTRLAAPQSFHDLRIALKNMRYGVQIFRGLYAKPVRKPYMASMAAMQDALGDLSDAVLAQKLANMAAESQGKEAMRAAGFVCGYHAASTEASAKNVADAWAIFEKKTPFWQK